VCTRRRSVVAPVAKKPAAKQAATAPKRVAVQESRLENAAEAAAAAAPLLPPRAEALAAVPSRESGTAAKDKDVVGETARHEALKEGATPFAAAIAAAEAVDAARVAAAAGKSRTSKRPAAKDDEADSDVQGTETARKKPAADLAARFCEGEAGASYVDSSDEEE